MIDQWQEELEIRFGLTFEVMDRTYIERVRQQRGYGVNPWTTFPRFLVSQRLLVDETYVGPMRDWLGSLRPAALLISTRPTTQRRRAARAMRSTPGSRERFVILLRASSTDYSIRDAAQRALQQL